MMLERENGDADWPLAENISERRQDGTYIPGSEPENALRVEINDGGTLGTGSAALVVHPGTGQIQGTEHTIRPRDSRTLDINLPRGKDRRDVVYLSDAGTLEVRRGRGGSLDWGSGVASGARTFANAARPPPRDLVGTPGLVLAVVTVRSGRNALDTDAVDRVDVRPPADEYVETGTVNDNAIQTALDGQIAVATPNHGVIDAIDPAAVANPPQAAIDIINNEGYRNGYVGVGRGSGSGTIYYPAGVIQTPGGITGAGAKRHIGMGTASSVLELTDPAGDLFVATGKKDASYSYWDGLTLAGGDKSNRTAGSAFHFLGPGGGINFNVGTLAFAEWGSDPIIYGDGAFIYGSTWGNLFARSYSHDGPVLKVTNSLTYGFDVRLIGCGPDDPTVPAVEFDNASLGGRIGVINSGGKSGKVLRHDGRFYDAKGSRVDSLHIGWINSEPNDPQSTEYVVRLEGDTPVSIRHISHSDALSVTGNVVQLAEHVHSDGSTTTGPGRKRIGTIHDHTNSPSGPFIDVLAAPSVPSWHWGPASNINYNGHDSSAVIPLADVRPGSGGGTDTSASATESQVAVAANSTATKTITPPAGSGPTSLSVAGGAGRTLGYATGESDINLLTTTWKGGAGEYEYVLENTTASKKYAKATVVRYPQ